MILPVLASLNLAFVLSVCCVPKRDPAIEFKLYRGESESINCCSHSRINLRVSAFNELLISIYSIIVTLKFE